MPSEANHLEWLLGILDQVSENASVGRLEGETTRFREGERESK